MEKYPSDSGDSSPGSREFDLENPGEDKSSSLPPPPKLKFLVSYGGSIHPRPHDNLLSYLGGDTKILALQPPLNFNLLLSKLSSLVSPHNHAGFTFKYQLPGEDLDALISVTNDDDLQHMMHEYHRASSKPSRLRLFLFPNHPSTAFTSTTSDHGNLDPARSVVEALHSVPLPDTIHPPPPPVAAPVVSAPPMPMSSNVDFLFGLENPLPVQVVSFEPELALGMNRLHVSAQEEQQEDAVAYRQRSDENLAANYAGEMFQKGPLPPVDQIPAGYWQAVEQHHQLAQQQQQQHQQHQPAPPPQQHPLYHHQQPPQQQPLYMMYAPPQSGMYQAQVMRASQQTQGYYQGQRMPPDPIYRELPVYSKPAQAAQAPMVTSNQAEARAVGENTAGYQVGYDSTGRQVYYAAAPTGEAVTAQYQGVAGAAVNGGEMRASGDGKVVQKVVPTSGTARV